MLNVRIFRLLSDKSFIRIKYKLLINEKLNLDNPVGFNEKIQWLKLKDRNATYSDFVDKLKVRVYVKEKIGKEYLVVILGDYSNFPSN